MKDCMKLSCFSNVWKGRLTVFGSLLIHTCLSIVLAYGSWSPYFISYFRTLDPSVSVATSQFIMSLYAIGLIITNIYAIKLSEDVFGVRLHCAVFILLYSVGLYILSITKSSTVGIIIVVVCGGSYGMVNVVT